MIRAYSEYVSAREGLRASAICLTQVLQADTMRRTLAAAGALAQGRAAPLLFPVRRMWNPSVISVLYKDVFTAFCFCSMEN